MIRRAVLQDIPALMDIYNEAILHTTATFDTEVKDMENRKAWFAEHNGLYVIYVLAYAAECDEIDTVISLITSENAASIHLHEVYGFEYCGQIKNAGTKFGRKLSLNAYQILYDR